jgi:conjugative transposon TraM protein
MSEQSPKKSMLLFVLPLLALPFLMFAFWALGGGRVEREINGDSTDLNISLPDAHLPNDSAMDKMSFYEQQEKEANTRPALPLPDSIQSLLNPDMDMEAEGSDNSLYDYNQYTTPLYKGSSIHSTNNNEKEIRFQMKQLQESLHNAEIDEADARKNIGLNSLKESVDADKKSKLAETAEAEETPDPEMEKLQAMMNRIYDIQHPDEVNERIQKKSEAKRGTVFPVSNTIPANTVHLLSAKNIGGNTNDSSGYATEHKGFFGLSTTKWPQQTADKGIVAIVQENTTILNGASVKLRLLEDVYVNGTAIPAGNFLTGQAQLSNDRIIVEVTSILYNQYVFEVNLSAFDSDGMQGLYVPDAIDRDVLKASGDNAIQSLGITSLDPSFGAQAAAAGIETAKSLFSRKLKLAKVFLKTGHKIILKNNQQ